MSLYLTLCVGCSPKQIITEPQVIRTAPPALLLEPTPAPKCRNTATTNGGLLRCYGEYQDALGKANADKAALKQITLEAQP